MDTDSTSVTTENDRPRAPARARREGAALTRDYKGNTASALKDLIA
jgi:hypothetical protein